MFMLNRLRFRVRLKSPMAVELREKYSLASYFGVFIPGQGHLGGAGGLRPGVYHGGAAMFHSKASDPHP